MNDLARREVIKSQNNSYDKIIKMNINERNYKSYDFYIVDLK